MIQQLERAIVASSAVDHWKTPSLCTAHIMATGVVRFAHTTAQPSCSRKQADGGASVS
jgi:hypothetical protein